MNVAFVGTKIAVTQSNMVAVQNHHMTQCRKARGSYAPANIGYAVQQGSCKANAYVAIVYPNVQPHQDCRMGCLAAVPIHKA